MILLSILCAFLLIITNSQPIQNYTYINDLLLNEIIIADVQYSPDGNGFIYLVQNDPLSFYYVSRQLMTLDPIKENQIQHVALNFVGNTHQIQAVAFHPSSSKILVVTKFKDSNINKRSFLWYQILNDLVSSFFIEYVIQIDTLSNVNSVCITQRQEQGDIVALVMAKSFVSTFNSQGKQLSYNYFYPLGILSVKCLPNTNYILVAGTAYSSNSQLGFFTLLDTKLNQNQTINQYHTLDLAVTKDFSLAFQLSQERGLEAFSITSNKTFESIGQFLTEEKSYNRIKLSQNGDFLVLHKSSEPKQFHTFKVTKPTKTNYLSSKSTEITEIFLQPIKNISYVNSSLEAFSSNGNQLLIAQIKYQLAVIITWYGLCDEGYYLMESSCQKCSQSCLSCFKNQSKCTSCNSTNFDSVLYNSSCVNCSQAMSGCLTCNQSQYCLSCDEQNNFTLIKNRCECEDFFFLQNKTCVLCDDHKLCLQCESKTKCIFCNNYSGFNAQPENGQCVCQDYKYQDGYQCQNCNYNFDKKCIKCKSINECVQCDTRGNWILAGNKCVCSSDYTEYQRSERDQTQCIYCPIKGCKICQQSNTCLKCSKQNYFDENPLNNTCQCQQNYELLNGGSICSQINDDSASILPWVIVLAVLIILAILIICGRKIIERRKQANRVYLLEEEENKRVGKAGQNPILMPRPNQRLNRFFGRNNIPGQNARKIVQGQIRPFFAHSQLEQSFESYIEAEDAPPAVADSSKNQLPKQRPQIFQPMNAKEVKFEEQIISGKVEQKASQIINKQKHILEKPEIKEQQRKPDNMSHQSFLINAYNKALQGSDVQLQIDPEKHVETVQYGDQIFAQLDDSEKIRLDLLKE